MNTIQRRIVAVTAKSMASKIDVVVSTPIPHKRLMGVQAIMALALEGRPNYLMHPYNFGQTL